MMGAIGEEDDLARLSAVAAHERMAAGLALGVPADDQARRRHDRFLGVTVPGPRAGVFDDDGVIPAAALAAKREPCQPIAVIDSMRFVSESPDKRTPPRGAGG